MKQAKRPAILLMSIFLVLGFMGHFGCSGGGGGGSDSENTLGPGGTDAGKQIGSEGGQVEITDGAARGVKLVVPPGAVAEGDSEAFSIRAADSQGAQQIEPAEMDIAGATMQYSTTQSETVTHPYYATLLASVSDFRAAGPLLEFGPHDVEFLKPVEIHIPFDKNLIDELEATYMTVFYGDYDAGSATFSGERATDITVDYKNGVVVARVLHFSFMQSVFDAWDATKRRIAGLTLRPFIDLPPAPSLTESMASSIVCSGYEPHVDIHRLPDPVYLLYYLASPMDAESRVVDPVQHAKDRQYYQNKRVVVGHEVALEDWVLTQSNDSVTCEALFAEAYKMLQGDVFQALLLSHNVLRGFDGANRYGDVRGTAIQQRMADLVGTGKDEAGYRYHYFGMATFGFIMRLSSYFAQDFYAGLEVPFLDVDEEMASTIVYLEECLVSGDCLSDPAEYAVDLRGRETGQELADKLFDGFVKYKNKFDGVSLNDVADRYGVDVGTCIEVKIQGKRQYTLGEYVSLELVMKKGTGTAPGVEWFYQGSLLMTGPEFFYKFDKVGDYLLRVRVTDDSLLQLNTSVTVNVSATPAVAEEYVIYYTDNVRCWGAPWLLITDRESFNAWRSTASYSGGGIDWTEEAIKVEVQGGFDTVQEAENWLCPKITGWHFSYWCGGVRAHYLVSGQTLDFRLGSLGCDLSGVPEVAIPDPHPGM